MVNLKTNYIGLQINYLKIIKQAEDGARPSGEKVARLLCKCVCGKKVIKEAHDIAKSLKTGKGCKSCGCKTNEILSKLNTKHGHTKSNYNETKVTREYYTYRGMHKRCYDKNNPSYHNYGGRGITVCERWSGDKGFKNFLKDMGLKPKGLTIERIDTNGNYEPNNCKWATQKEQLNNTRNTIKIKYNDVILPLTTWAEILEIKPDTLRCRSVSGWSDSRIIETPVDSDRILFYFSPYLVSMRKKIYQQ